MSFRILFLTIAFFASSIKGFAATPDTFIPWEGGPAYYAKWSNGPSTSPDFFPICVWAQSPQRRHCTPARKFRAHMPTRWQGTWTGPRTARSKQGTSTLRVSAPDAWSLGTLQAPIAPLPRAQACTHWGPGCLAGPPCSPASPPGFPEGRCCLAARSAPGPAAGRVRPRAAAAPAAAPFVAAPA